MSQLVVELEGDNLIIQCQRARMRKKDTQVVDIRKMTYNKKYKSYVKSNSESKEQRILFWEEMQIALPDESEEVGENSTLHGKPGDLPEEDSSLPEEDNTLSDEENTILEGAENMEHKVLFAIAQGNRVQYGYMEASRIYKLLIQFVYKVIHIRMTKKKLHIYMLSYLVNHSNELQIENVRFYVDEMNQMPVNMNVYDEKLSKHSTLLKHNYHHLVLLLENLLTDETKNNNMLKILVTVNGVDLDFRIGKKNKKFKSGRKYYAPYKGGYLKDFAIHLRRTDRGNFAIVKRPMEDIERTLKFRILESRPVSWGMYYLGKLVRKISRKKVNLFFEKFAEKAEEGAYDLFCIAKNRRNSENYFIIDEHSPDYEAIKREKNVVKKYSLKYYWLLYRVNHYIATEAPAHLNILRSNNKYFRLSTCEHPFVFLQHGVTYLKCQGQSSTFVKGKEGEPAYMIVGSQKEQDVVCDMLHLPEERVLNTGLPIFSKIAYGHINESTPDKVVIMLTWKSYEEHIMEFENSMYYKNVMEVYHLLEKYVSPANIIIVPHPKMAELCENTSLNETMWKKPISEVLGVAKLLITDYSSVCYNSFYQGGGVIFYQPDLELFEKEAGPLIPAEDEYIGKRVFDIEALEAAVGEVIQNGRISLKKLRTPEYLENYQSINEYHDGKNIERIAEELVRLEII